MTVLQRQSDTGRLVIERLGLQRPIVELIYLSFLGSAVGHVAGGGGFGSKPLENLAMLVLVFGVYVPRLILLRKSIVPILRHPPPFQFFFILQAILLPLRLVLGFWNGSPKVYVVTDLLLAIAAILIYVVSRAEYERQLPISDVESLRALVPIVLIMLFLGFLPMTIATPGFNVAVMGAVLVLLLAATRSAAWQSLIGVVIFGLYALSVPRGFILAVGFVTVLIALSNIFWRTIFIGGTAIVSLVVAVVLNYQSIPNLPLQVIEIGEITQAAEKLDWSNLDAQDVFALVNVSASIHERVWEAQQVVGVLDQNGIFSWIFGMGYGASLNMSNAPDKTVRNAAQNAGLSGRGLVHNVHLVIFEQLFRFGLLGLSIFLWIGLRMLQIYWRCRAVIMRERRLTFDFICALTLIGSYVNFQFESDWDIAFVGFAILGYLDARFATSNGRVWRSEKNYRAPVLVPIESTAGMRNG